MYCLSELFMQSSTTVPRSKIVAQFRSVHAACFEQPLHEVQTTDASELVETDRTNSTQKTVSSATVLVLQSMHTVQHCVYTVVRAVRAIEYL